MSRKEIIESHLGKRLFRHVSLEFQAMGIPPDETLRTLFVTADISAAVTSLPDTPEGARRAEFRAWLDAFIEGGEISVAEDPRNKPPGTMLSRVCPVEAEFWSIRVNDPDTTPGIRSLGAFSDTDEFVALIWEMRELIPDFDDEVDAAIACWKDYFGDEPPHRGDSIDEYLTDNYRSV